MCVLGGSIQPSSALKGADDVADYIGCFKPRDNADNRLRLRTHRWYDPHWELFEGDSSKYAEGPFYIIHGSIIDGLVRSGLTVRMGGPNEGQLPYERSPAHLQNLCRQMTLPGANNDQSQSCLDAAPPPYHLHALTQLFLLQSLCRISVLA